MPRLRDLQLDFLHSIFSGDGTNFPRHVVANGLVGNQRMAIYRNNVFGCLTKTLEAAYPVILRLVGEGFFKRIATEFIYQNPSTSGDLHRFGGDFAKFLSCFPAAAELTYLPDIARLEWLCHEVFYEADQGALDINTLACVPTGRYNDLKFKLHPATRLFVSSFPVHKIWEVNQLYYCGDQTVNLNMGGVRLLVKRNRHRVELQVLTDGEWTFLQGIASGMEFADICESTLQADPLLDLNGIVCQLVAQSIIVDFTLPQKSRNEEI